MPDTLKQRLKDAIRLGNAQTPEEVMSIYRSQPAVQDLDMCKLAEMPGFEEAKGQLSPEEQNQIDKYVQKCVGNLKIKLVYGNDTDTQIPYMENSKVLIGGGIEVKIDGPVSKTEVTSSGMLEFKDIPSGEYDITATYKEKVPLVDTAKTYINLCISRLGLTVVTL